MATSDSGSGEELRLKITPELDQAALKKAQDQLDALKTTTAVGGTGKGTASAGQTNAVKQQVTALKELVAVEKLAIDQIDLRLRKTRSAATAEIAAIRERAAAGKITMQQMNQQIIQQEQLIESANLEAEQGFLRVGQSLENLQSEYAGVAGAQQLIINRQKQLFYAQERMASGFNSMSGSMQTMVSQTKQANLAFMNFGRIVQDAPFGLIGIANNIDPMLMSFRALSTEIDATTGKVRGNLGAFKALGAQLFGPAGLIFLLGSALPSALLVLQRRQQETGKESNALADAFKRVSEEFAKLAAESAGKRGIPVISQELAIAEKALKKVEKEISTVSSSQRGLNETLSRTGSQLNDLTKEQSASLSNQIRENEARLKALGQTKEFLSNNVQQLKVEKERINANKFINEAREELGLAESLREDEKIKNQQEVDSLLAKELKLRDQILGEIQEEKNRINKEIRDSKQRLKDLTDEGLKAGLTSYIMTLEEQLPLVEEKIRAKHEKANKKTKDDTKDTLEELAKFQLEYTKYIQNELQNRLLDAKISYEEIAKSEFATDQQRLVARRKYLEIEQSIFDEYRQKARTKDEKDRQEKLKKDLEARKEFVKKQEEIIKISEERQETLRDFALIAASFREDALTRIQSDGDRARDELQKIANEKGLENTREYLAADAALHAETERQKRQYAINTLNEIFNAMVAVGNLAFGETKELRVAQVVIDTIFGVQRILAEGKFSAMAIAKSIALAANGAIAVRKILSTEKGGTSVGTSPSGSTTTNEVFMERSNNTSRFQSPFANQIASQASPRDMFGEGAINIQANVDRRGLAIAVREGERSIRTQQFDYR
jgi:hypothetical protein